MIVGAYSLDLYCDMEGKNPHPYEFLPNKYVGNTRGDCFTQARNDGWILNYRRDKAICPLCSGKVKHDKNSR